jgi:adenosylcobinamide amidohydrolase
MEHETIKILETAMQDKVYRYEKRIVAFFGGKRKVLSTSVYNGGYHEDFTSVFNHDCTVGPGMPCAMLAPTYEGHMRIVAKKIGLDPVRTSGIGTAADMKNAAVVSAKYEELTVAAVVTGGIERNAGRVGDPASYYKPEKIEFHPGTINIMLFLDCNMPAGTLARALVTCTEAKSAAIQELLEGSCYSTGIATGSGTDQTIIVANAESKLYLDDAGKHAKLGELIGIVVKQAVKDALDKQTGLNPATQHNALRRLKRFGVTADSIWEQYNGLATKPLLKPQFLEQLQELACNHKVVTITSLYVHLLDQFGWGLLELEETKAGCLVMLKLLASYLHLPEPNLPEAFTWQVAISVLTKMLTESLAGKSE